MRYDVNLTHIQKLFVDEKSRKLGYIRKNEGAFYNSIRDITEEVPDQLRSSFSHGCIDSFFLYKTYFDLEEMEEVA